LRLVDVVDVCVVFMLLWLRLVCLG